MDPYKDMIKKVIKTRFVFILGCIKPGLMYHAIAIVDDFFFEKKLMDDEAIIRIGRTFASKKNALIRFVFLLVVHFNLHTPPNVTLRVVCPRSINSNS